MSERYYRAPSQDEQSIPCAVCGTKTYMLGTKRCHNCWEVEHRLEYYLRSAAGRQTVKVALEITTVQALKSPKGTTK